MALRPCEIDLLRKHIASLTEAQIWDLLATFFISQGVRTTRLHSPGEHGMDVLACVDPGRDVLGRPHNIVIQVKPGDLTLADWRKVLLQLLEAPYYPIGAANVEDNLPRRVVLVIAGKITPEARAGIKGYNLHHDITIESFELDEIVHLFNTTGFAEELLQQVGGLGEASPIPEVVQESVGVGHDLPTPPYVG
jgi:hypothetical protein